MNLQKGKNSLTREQASAIYDDLRAGFQKKMASMKGAPGAAPGAAAKPQAARREVPAAELSTEDIMKMIQRAPGKASSTEPRQGRTGSMLAILFVVLFAGLKVTIAVLEHSGVVSVEPAEATMAVSEVKASMSPTAFTPAVIPQGQFSKEEYKILVSLDSRRQELEERSKKLDDRSMDQDRRDREFAAKLTELRELTDKLKVDRDKDDKKRENQLAQLSNVYGSMAPEEAAALMEQLDVTIALSLIQRMPEKRIGQILSHMSPERALAITRMMSGPGVGK